MTNQVTILSKEIEALLEQMHLQHNKPYELDIVPPTEELRATEFILDGLIQAGVVVIAAYAGAGKTTGIIALVMRVTGLIVGDEFEPSIKRKAIIFTEHADQIEEILYAMVLANVVPYSYQEVRKMITLVNSKRMSIDEISECAQAISENYNFENYRNNKKYEAKPWVILDTSNANLDFENENDSQSVGKIIATVKTEFFIQRKIPITIITHTAKALKYDDTKSLSARGSGAIEGDCHQVIYLLVIGDGPDAPRAFSICDGKHRFFCKSDFIRLIPFSEMVNAIDQFDDVVTYPVLFAGLKMMSLEEKKALKTEVQEKSREANATNRENEMRAKIIDVAKRWLTLSQSGHEAVIPTRNAIYDRAGGNKTSTFDLIDTLITEGHLMSYEINEANKQDLKSSGLRPNNKATHYCWLKVRDDQFFDIKPIEVSL